MVLNARVDVNYGRKDGRTDGRKTGCLNRTLLKQMRPKKMSFVRLSADILSSMMFTMPFASTSGLGLKQHTHRPTLLC